ncbi:hypothetical protein JCM21142_337 [Saccharicrinis fermentans DSM 9555 = JCM 21142]|uniref:Uncharacterized protein n=1 Tax=Saccharicrinis fermentans DSM 9555 = JCM 21142 TaxID=869213 RepID=W7Y2F7_9BACT|nr:hypothetical protein JCM21142_337 [Saccharicrinis fermentans DSM 9555 = JCM 21142]
MPLYSLCKKTPNTALFSFLKQSFTISKLLGFKNIESLVFEAFLSKTEKIVVFLQPLYKYVITDGCDGQVKKHADNIVECSNERTGSHRRVNIHSFH